MLRLHLCVSQLKRPDRHPEQLPNDALSYHWKDAGEVTREKPSLQPVYKRKSTNTLINWT